MPDGDEDQQGLFDDFVGGSMVSFQLGGFFFIFVRDLR